MQLQYCCASGKSTKSIFLADYLSRKVTHKKVWECCPLFIDREVSHWTELAYGKDWENCHITCDSPVYKHVTSTVLHMKKRTFAAVPSLMVILRDYHDSKLHSKSLTNSLWLYFFIFSEINNFKDELQYRQDSTTINNVHCSL